MTPSVPPATPSQPILGSASVGLDDRLERWSAAEVLELVARGGEPLDPDVTPAGQFLADL